MLLQLVWNSDAAEELKAQVCGLISLEMAASASTYHDQVSQCWKGSTAAWRSSFAINIKFCFTLQSRVTAYQSQKHFSRAETIWIYRALRSYLYATQALRFPGLHIEASLPPLPKAGPVASRSHATVHAEVLSSGLYILHVLPVCVSTTLLCRCADLFVVLSLGFACIFGTHAGCLLHHDYTNTSIA